MWGIWKERTGRVFHNKALQPDMVAHLVWEEISQRTFAHSLVFNLVGLLSLLRQRLL
jgi:hypothetical protein